MFEKTYIAIAILVVIFIVSLSIVFGENYNYNMTKKEKQEFNLMALCYQKDIILDQITTDGIPLHKFCAERYGGIDTDYGEAIK